MNQKRSFLPIGISDFEQLISANYNYVDKTESISKIASEFGGFFLSRPRRFGKSLLVSTFKQLFLGNKALFKNTWIYNSDWKWEAHPVIHFDMSGINSDTKENLEETLKAKLLVVAKAHNISLQQHNSVTVMFDALILELSKINKVVILIDEYDAPILRNIDNMPLAKITRDTLKNFYETIKKNNAYERFVFVTGVTKFSQTSMFSGMNQLIDLTMDQLAPSLLGYTQAELESNFSSYLNDAATKNNLEKPALLAKIKEWYNGYRFSKNNLTVYNPVSIHNFFNSGDFENYWFSTGTPTLIFKLIEQNNYNIQEIKNIELDATTLTSFDIEQIPFHTLLFQTGYLTITGYDSESMDYTLNFPNREVKQSFLRAFLNYSHNNASAASVASHLSKAIKSNNIQRFVEFLHSFFASIPYDLHIAQERFFHGQFYSIFSLLGYSVFSEVKSNKGRTDAVLETSTHIYLFEFKIKDSAKVALQQIKDNKYFEQFLNKQKTIVLVGIQFSLDEKNLGISDWTSQEL